MAALPQQAPFDIRAFLVGTWQSTEHVIETQAVTVIGRYVYEFAADGTFTGSNTGSYNQTTFQPGDKPGTSIPAIKQHTLNSELRGKYTVTPGPDGFYAIRLDGKETDHASRPSRTHDYVATVEVRRSGLGEMRTRFGVIYRRRGL